jgi:uncharacterized protein YyaL (SSP411 family)
MIGGILWRKRLYRPEAIRLVARDLLGRRETPRESSVHLGEAARWIARASEATPDAGVSAGYGFEEGWLASYPETTGYIIPTLLTYAEYSGEEDYTRRALEMADWLLTVQLAGGGFPGHFVDRANPPVVFNTGQIIFGLLAAHEQSKDARFLDAAVRAAAWLTSVQDADGAWRRFDYRQAVHVYNTRTAWAMIELAMTVDDRAVLRAAERHLDWALTQQEPDGWFRSCAFDPTEDPFLHTIAYTTQGLLEAGIRRERSDWIAAAERGCAAVLARVDERGSIPGTFGPRWRSRAAYSCLTGNAQMAAQWLRLFEVGGDERWLLGARRSLAFLKSLHDCRSGNLAVRGAVKGSHPIWGRYLFGTYPNWAAKFFMDALLLDESLRGQGPRPRCW